MERELRAQCRALPLHEMGDPFLARRARASARHRASCTRINLERLATRGQRSRSGTACTWAIPDTLVGTDSHTPMINGIGVLAWGVGGLEAESVMFGMPVMLRIPDVIGVRLTGASARRACLRPILRSTVTERLRRRGDVRRVRRVLRPRCERRLSAGERCRRRQHGAGIWRFDRLFSHRSSRRFATCAQLDATSSKWRSCRAYAQRQHLWFDPDSRTALHRTSSRSTWA